VRKLEPKDFQMEFAKFGKINRYQVLYEEGALLPSWEEVQSSMILAPSDEVPDTHINDIGGAGDDAALSTLSHTLAHAYARAVQSRTGQVRNVASEINHARRLALADISTEQVRAATVQACDQALARRAGVPSLADVARLIGGVQ
jgi:hypothetical protein